MACYLLIEKFTKQQKSVKYLRTYFVRFWKKILKVDIIEIESWALYE